MFNDYEKAYERYFGNSNKSTKEVINDNLINTVIKGENKDNDKPISSRSRLTSNGNIDDIDKLGEALRKLLNAAWGSNWGVLSPEESGDNPEEITMPQINYYINLREIANGTSPKPTLMDTVAEEVDGVKTGDSYRIYRQSFDCIVEFCFLCQTSKDCRELMNNFEELIITYSGYLKEQGVGEIFFLKEVPPRYSLNFKEKLPMKCCYYYVRLERNRQIKVSKINEIEMKLKNKI